MKNLSYALQEYKLSIGAVNTMHDQQYIQWFVSCLRKMRQLELYQECLKSVRLPIEKEFNTSNLPMDFNGLVQIGICCGNRLINFDRNESLCDPGGCPCNDGEVIANTIAGCCGDNTLQGAWPFWAYPLWGEPFSYSYSAGSYGIGPGFYGGGYKINQANGTIYFDGCVKADHCTLIYFGNFMDDSGNAMVTDDMVEVLINYAEYCRRRFSGDRFVRAEAPGAKGTWFRSVQDYNAKNQQLNKSDWLKLFRRFSFMGVKA